MQKFLRMTVYGKGDFQARLLHQNKLKNLLPTEADLNFQELLHPYCITF